MNTRTLALAAALALVPATAFAAPHSAEVQYKDLDLSTPKGMKELDKRIDNAAKEVCTVHGVVITGSVATSRLDQKCYREALARLQDQLAAPTGHKREG